MSVYLQFFQLEQSPFEGEAQGQVVLGTQALRDAFSRISTGLEEGASRICLSGGAGLGKTSLARALPKLLGDSARVASVSDPSVPWESLRGPIAKQWGLKGGGLARAQLVAAAGERRLVLVIDQAERASEELLDHLDVVLSYRSESDQPVVQAVLLAQLSGADLEGAKPTPLLWWLDRIQTLQLEFAPLPRDGVASYIQKHLKRAGWRGGRLFSEGAAFAIHEYTSGIPGDVSSLCERLLAEAAYCDLREIDEGFVRTICDEAETTGSGDIPWSFDDEVDEFEELLLDQPVSEPGDLEPPPTAQASSPSKPGNPGSPQASADARGSSAPLTETLMRLNDSSAGEADGPEANDAGMPDAVSDGQRSAEGADSSDPNRSMLESFLSSPPTRDELRAIRSAILARHARAIAAAAVAAVIAGLAFAFLVGGEDGSTTGPAPDAQKLAQQGPTSSARGSDAPPLLARVRGPVVDEAAGDPRRAAPPEPAKARPENARPAPARVVTAPGRRTALDRMADGGGPLRRVAGGSLPRASLAQDIEAEADEDPSELDTDARPGGLPPAASPDPVAQEKFW